MILVALLLVSVVIAMQIAPARRFRAALRKRARSLYRATWQRLAPLDVHVSERRPLSILDKALKQGGALYFDQDRREYGFASSGALAGRGASLAELALMLGLAEGRIPTKPWCYLRLSHGMLRTFAKVKNTGESLSAFTRTAVQQEIARRFEQDRAVCGFLDGADYLADLEGQEVQHAQRAA